MSSSHRHNSGESRDGMGINMQHQFVHRAGKLSFSFDVVATAFQMCDLALFKPYIVLIIQLLSHLRFGRKKQDNSTIFSRANGTVLDSSLNVYILSCSVIFPPSSGSESRERLQSTLLCLLGTEFCVFRLPHPLQYCTL